MGDRRHQTWLAIGLLAAVVLLGSFLEYIGDTLRLLLGVAFPWWGKYILGVVILFIVGKIVKSIYG